MQYLKADTAATILIGPFVDAGDGVTPETGITLAAADHAELMKHDGTTFVDLTSDSRTFTHKEGGWYTLVLGTGDTDTEGRLTVLIMDTSVCLPVWKDFMVVNANVYDSLFAAAATDYLQVDAVEISGDSTAADNLESACDNYSVTRGLTGTALPAAAADAAGGLLISDAGGLDLDTKLANGNEITAARMSELDAGTAGKMANQVDEIRTDTEDLQTQVGTDGAGLTNMPWNSDWDAEAQSEAADALTAYGPPTKAEMDTAHALLATPAQVNTQVVDALNTDTYAEPGQGAPAATATLAAKIGYLYKFLRNKVTQTATELRVYGDDGSTVDQKATVSDDGTTYSRGEIGSGA